MTTDNFSSRVTQEQKQGLLRELADQVAQERRWTAKELHLLTVVLADLNRNKWTPPANRFLLSLKATQHLPPPSLSLRVAAHDPISIVESEEHMASVLEDIRRSAATEPTRVANEAMSRAAVLRDDPNIVPLRGGNRIRSTPKRADQEDQ